jgi:hypothetical protein
MRGVVPTLSSRSPRERASVLTDPVWSAAMDDDGVLARYEAELAPEHAMRALVIKLSWLPTPTGISPNALEHLRFPLRPDE